MEQQVHPNQNTETDITNFLEYAITYPNVLVKLITSDMVIRIDSDASLLSKERERSCTGWYHYLSSKMVKPTKYHTYHHQKKGQYTDNV